MKDQLPDLPSRLSIRERPTGPPIMYQSWGKLLFMHWQVPIEALRPVIPRPLAIDTYEGETWIGLIPFTLWDVRPRFMPSLPGISNFHELNVRTYVHLNGIPGIWFFSLDANSQLAVMGARTLFQLPYYYASIDLEQHEKTIICTSRRRDGKSPAAFHATWTIGADMPQAEPGSLDFFLVERYCLYTSHKGRLYRCRVSHEPWPLQQARLSKYDSNVLEANGLPTPKGEPLLHGGGPVHVETWPLERV